MPLDCNTSQNNTSVVEWEYYVVDDVIVVAAAEEEEVVVAVAAMRAGESQLEQVAGFARMMRLIQRQRYLQYLPGLVVSMVVTHPRRQIQLATTMMDPRVILVL